jgi:hypothetical protein
MDPELQKPGPDKFGSKHSKTFGKNKIADAVKKTECLESEAEWSKPSTCELIDCQTIS